MSTKIFVNLPVRDLKQAVDFFTQLGFTFNAQFTDETATSMIVSDDMALHKERMIHLKAGTCRCFR
jgi:predicted lactoylglutathione lyase